MDSSRASQLHDLIWPLRLTFHGGGCLTTQASYIHKEKNGHCKNKLKLVLIPLLAKKDFAQLLTQTDVIQDFEVES